MQFPLLVVFIVLIISVAPSVAHPLRVNNTSLTQRSAHHAHIKSRAAKKQYAKLDKKKPYRIVSLSDGEQGSTSYVFTIVKGFPKNKEMVPALLKVIPSGVGVDSDKEVENLEKVKLLLFHKKNKDFHRIVIQNVRHGYPQKDSPELRPIHEWYKTTSESEGKGEGEDDNQTQENERRDVPSLKEGLQKMRTNTKKYCMDIAERYSLLIGDFNLPNFMTDRSIEYVVNVDWGAPRVDESGKRIGGVTDLKVGEGRKETLERYEKHAEKMIEKSMSEEAYEEMLKRMKEADEAKVGDKEDDDDDEDESESESDSDTD